MMSQRLHWAIIFISAGSRPVNDLLFKKFSMAGSWKRFKESFVSELVFRRAKFAKTGVLVFEWSCFRRLIAGGEGGNGSRFEKLSSGWSEGIGSSPVRSTAFSLNFDPVHGAKSEPRCSDDGERKTVPFRLSCGEWSQKRSCLSFSLLSLQL